MASSAGSAGVGGIKVPRPDMGVDDLRGVAQLLTVRRDELPARLGPTTPGTLERGAPLATRFQNPCSRPRVASTTNWARSCGRSDPAARPAIVVPWNGRRLGGLARHEHRRPSADLENMTFMPPASPAVEQCHRISSYPCLRPLPTRQGAAEQADIRRRRRSGLRAAGGPLPHRLRPGGTGSVLARDAHRRRAVATMTPDTARVGHVAGVAGPPAFHKPSSGGDLRKVVSSCHPRASTGGRDRCTAGTHGQRKRPLSCGFVRKPWTTP
jgi:hypothetical protein